MIKGKRQLTLAQKKLENLVSMRDKLIADSKVEPLGMAQEMKLFSLQGVIRDLKNDIEHCQALVSGKVTSIAIDNLSDLGSKLIEVRIAKRITQAELAGRMKMTQQQLQRYEKQEYSTMSFEKLCKLMDSLGVEIKKTKILIQPDDEGLEFTESISNR